MSTRADEIYEKDLSILKNETERETNKISPLRSDVTKKVLNKIINHHDADSLIETQQTNEVGDLLVSYLEQIDVEYVFGIPGGAIEPLYNALARSKRRGGLRPVIARHETGAAFMADGYARNSGRLGVCCGTAGPGTTNLITGVASEMITTLLC